MDAVNGFADKEGAFMRRNPWATLTVLALAQFMVVLDVTIVNVALPDIQQGLHFSADNLQWVISAYTLVFGGFLLLGGRAADLLGRRRLFLAGLVIFAAASLAGGLATSPGMLIAVRVVQGFGGAMLSPAALSILTVTFAHGRERNIALGIWGGLAGLGGTLGVIAGGVLVDSAGWEWVFFVNVPLAVVLVAVTPLLVPESRVAQVAGVPRQFDAAGAVLGTGSVLALIFGVIRAEPLGWSSAEVIGSLVAGVLLMAGFVVVERRSPAPLVPLRLFRSRGLSTSTGSLALNGAAFLAMFYLSALFLQQVQGLSALRTGLEFLPMGVAAIVAAVLASSAIARFGTRPVQLAGSALSVVGLLLLTRAGASGSYVTDLLPGFLLFGVGIMGVGVPSQISAVADVQHEEAGAASGVVTSGYQIGGAFGLALVTTLADTRFADLVAAGEPVQQALVAAFHRGLLGAAGYAAVNVFLALGSPQLVPDAEQLAEAVPA
jgi:EmrB/QacA subfamily drug resistance transporter